MVQNISLFLRKYPVFFYVMIAAVSAVLFLRYGQYVEPTYQVTYELSQATAERKAEEFLSEQVIPTYDFRRATVFNENNFGEDNLAITYLDKELGTDTLSHISQLNLVPLWFYTTRFYSHSVGEEYYVSIDSTGELVEFKRVTDMPTLAWANITTDQAQSMAERFIQTEARMDLTNWSLSNVTTAAGQYTFDWQHKSLQFKDATYHIYVDVTNGAITKFEKKLVVPQTWIETFTKQSQINQTVSDITYYVVDGVYIIIVILFIVLWRKRKLTFKWPLRLGAAVALINVVFPLSSIESLLYYNYTAGQNWLTFLATGIGGIVVYSLAQGALICMITAVGWYYYKATWPDVAASIKPTWPREAVIGTCLGVIIYGYQTIFFLAGHELGVWYAAVSTFNHAANSSLYFIFPLFYGVTAAALEEGVYRLFGISFLKKLLRHTGIAILLTTLLFGFIHSGNLVFPWYTRVLETTGIGLLLSVVFIRRGIIAVLVAHFTVNAIGTVIDVWYTKNLGLILPALLITAAPILLALFAWSKTKLVNRAVN